MSMAMVMPRAQSEPPRGPILLTVICIGCNAEVVTEHAVWLAVCPRCGGRSFKWDDNVVTVHTRRKNPTYGLLTR